MNAITTTEGVSIGTLEQVLGTGNLAALSPRQRVELMISVCRSRGLNPLTRPFRFLSLQGQVVMYATRDCADQLRKVDGVNIEITDKRVEGDLYVVEVRATDRTGRHDSDLGAVALGKLTGEFRANAILKCVTKAKRRVTLSICGLGLMDESEAENLPGATILDDDVVEHRAEANPVVNQGKPEGDGPEYPFATAKGGQIYRTGSEWMERWRRLVDACRLTDALDKLKAAGEMNAGPIAVVAEFDPEAAKEVREMIQATLDAATAAPPAEDEGEHELGLP